MTRIKRGTTKRKRKKNVLKKTKGFLNRRSTNLAAAKEALLKAGAFAHRDRRNKKREFRALWLIRANAGLRANGMTWSKFAAKLKKEKVSINRKMWAELAVKQPKIFEQVVKSLN